MRADAVVSLLRGKTVVCMASGPSLTADDAELVRGAAVPTMVTNTTFRMAPWASILVAHDAKWWAVYRSEVDATFAGLRVTCAVNGTRQTSALSLATLLKFRPFGNSGCSAISLAVLAGAKRVVLLGYDCQTTGGRVHWHGDHPSSLSNARSIKGWPLKFENVARYARSRGVQVVNASRATALQCFQRVRLEDEIRVTETA